MCNSKMCNWLKGLFGMKSCCEKKGCCEDKGCCEEKKVEETAAPVAQEPTAQSEVPATENQEEQKA